MDDTITTLVADLRAGHIIDLRGKRFVVTRRESRGDGTTCARLVNVDNVLSQQDVLIHDDLQVARVIPA